MKKRLLSICLIALALLLTFTPILPDNGRDAITIVKANEVVQALM